PSRATFSQIEIKSSRFPDPLRSAHGWRGPCDARSRFPFGPYEKYPWRIDGHTASLLEDWRVRSDRRVPHAQVWISEAPFTGARRNAAASGNSEIRATAVRPASDASERARRDDRFLHDRRASIRVAGAAVVDARDRGLGLRVVERCQHLQLPGLHDRGAV